MCDLLFAKAEKCCNTWLMDAALQTLDKRSERQKRYITYMTKNFCEKLIQPGFTFSINEKGLCFSLYEYIRYITFAWII